jgi:hypothetical protein
LLSMLRMIVMLRSAVIPFNGLNVIRVFTLDIIY